MPSLTAAQKQAAPQNKFDAAAARSRPRPAAPALSPILALHRTIGNQAVLRLTGGIPGGRSISGGPGALQPRLRLQPKLTVNEPGDAYEKEADRVAEQVMRMPKPGAAAAPGPSGQAGGAPDLQRACDCGGTCDDCRKQQGTEPAPVQMKAGPGNAGGREAPAIVHDALRAPGRPLDMATRAFMEPRFGRDFGAVRVHADEMAARSAAAMRARAYTVGYDVIFGAGEFAPNTRKGAQLLAHELAHVGQQGQAQAAGAVVQRKTDDALPLVPDNEEMCAPPNQGIGVLPIEQFIHYVEVVEEANPGRSPEEILTLIRKLYYSDTRFDRLLPDSPDVPAVESCHDDEGRPCSGPVGVCVCETVTDKPPPTPKLQKAIRCLKLHANENAEGDNPSPYVEVNGEWIDIGHVLLGVDALLHPRSEYRPYGKYGVTASMAAGWEADVGIAMVLLKEHLANNRKSQEVDSDPAPTLEDYYQYSAPMTDIIGDVDAFGVPFEKDGSLSHALRSYYLGDSGAGPGYRHRWAVFAEMNNFQYTFKGGKVTWAKETREMVKQRIITFADLYAARGDAMKMAVGSVEHRDWPDADKFADRFLKDIGERLEKDLSTGNG